MGGDLLKDQPCRPVGFTHLTTRGDSPYARPEVMAWCEAKGWISSSACLSMRCSGECRTDRRYGAGAACPHNLCSLTWLASCGSHRWLPIHHASACLEENRCART